MPIPSSPSDTQPAGVMNGCSGVPVSVSMTRPVPASANATVTVPCAVLDHAFVTRQTSSAPVTSLRATTDSNRPDSNADTNPLMSPSRSAASALSRACCHSSRPPAAVPTLGVTVGGTEVTPPTERSKIALSLGWFRDLAADQ